MNRKIINKINNKNKIVDEIKKILLGLLWQFKYGMIYLFHNKKKAETESNRIIFFGKCRSGALIMRGEHIVNALKSQGINAQTSVKKLPKDLNEKDIAIFIKDLYYKDIVFAKKRKAKIIYDIVDSFFYPFHLTFEPKICDGMLFPNKKMLFDYKRTNNINKCTSFYHNWDPRFKQHKNLKKRPFKIGYFGIFPNKNAIFFDELNVEDIGYEFQKHLEFGKDYPFHYSFRKKDTKEFKYKPHTKVATASICNSILITSKDYSSVEILGEDYPFYLKEDLNYNKKKIAQIKKKYERGELDIWFKKMKNIKERLSPESISKDYLNYLKKFNLNI